MLYRRLTQHYGDIAQQPRLGSVQIVMRGAHTAALHIHADMKQIALRVVERAQLHARRQLHQALGELGIRSRDVLRAQQQRPRKITAVHGGHIARAKRRERIKIIPVVELAAPLFQPFERIRAAAHALQHFIISNKAQLACRCAGNEIKADIGRRGAHGEPCRRIQLQVVRRQPDARSRHTDLEKVPGAARGVRKQRQRRRIQLRRAVSVAFGKVICPTCAHPEQPRQRQRRRKPERAQRARQRQYGRHAPRQAHIAHDLRRVRRRNPFHQVFLGYQQPPERAQYGIEHTQRGLRKHGKAQQRAPPGLCAAVKQRKQRFSERDQQRRHKCALCIRPQRVQQHQQQCGRIQAAQQISDDLQPIQSIQPEPRKQCGQQLPVAPRPAMQAQQIGLQARGAAIV